MSITNYNELKEAVEAKWPHRTDLTAFSADMITLGESHLNRRLRIREMEESATVTPSTSVDYVALPTGYMELVSFADDLGDELTEVSADQLQALRYSAASVRPECYRITSRIDFECVADQAYSYTMHYFKRLDIETDTTNTVLTSHPDLYLYASLVQVEAFVQNDQRIQLWKSLLEEAITDANNQSRRNKRLLRTELASVRPSIIRGY